MDIHPGSTSNFGGMNALEVDEIESFPQFLQSVLIHIVKAFTMKYENLFNIPIIAEKKPRVQTFFPDVIPIGE